MVQQYCHFYSKLHKFCNKILRMIYFRSPRSNCNDIHNMHKIMKIQEMFKLEVCSFIFKFFHKKLPKSFFPIMERTADYYTFELLFVTSLVYSFVCCVLRYYLPLFCHCTPRESMRQTQVKFWLSNGSAAKCIFRGQL